MGVRSLKKAIEGFADFKMKSSLILKLKIKRKLRVWMSYRRLPTDLISLKYISYLFLVYISVHTKRRNWQACQ